MNNEMGREYVICCQVSGGVTGFRESLLKKNGTVQVFTSKQEANDVARQLTKEANGPYATANFRYWAQEK